MFMQHLKNIHHTYPPQLICYISLVANRQDAKGALFYYEQPTITHSKNIKLRHKCTGLLLVVLPKQRHDIKIVFFHLFNLKCPQFFIHEDAKCERVNAIISDRHLIGQLSSGASRRVKGRCELLSARGATSLGEISASCTEKQQRTRRAGAKLSRCVWSADSLEPHRDYTARLRGGSLTPKMCPRAD